MRSTVPCQLFDSVDWLEDGSDSDDGPRLCGRAAAVELDDVEDDAFEGAVVSRRQPRKPICNPVTIRVPTRTTHALALMPSRMLSRVWGRVNSIPIPKRVRGPLYRSYSWAFGVNLDEVRYETRAVP